MHQRDNSAKDSARMCALNYYPYKGVRARF